MRVMSLILVARVFQPFLQILRLRTSLCVVCLAPLYNRSNRVNKSRGENHNSGLKTDLDFTAAVVEDPAALKMTPLRALYLALICHTAQARLSRSRSSRVHHSTMHHATMHHPITAGHTPHTSKALEALHKQREKKQAEAEAARRNATAKQPPPQAPKPAPRKPPPPRQAPPPRLSPTVVARAEATSCWLHVSGLHHSGTGPRERDGRRADRAVPGYFSGAGCWGPGVGAAPGAPRLSYVIGSPSRSSSPTPGRQRRAR